MNGSHRVNKLYIFSLLLQQIALKCVCFGVLYYCSIKISARSVYIIVKHDMECIMHMLVFCTNEANYLNQYVGLTLIVA